MAEFLMCAVKDELSETFLAPVFAKSEEEIIRLFDYQINNTPLWKENPSDFSIYQLGDYNEITGEVRANLRKIASGKSVWRKENKDDLQSVKQTENDSDDEWYGFP